MIKHHELRALGFELTHEIIEPSTPSSPLPDFREVAKHPSLKKSSVYLWLSPVSSKFGSSYEVLYVGKAGYGTTRRFSQHRGGFRNSTPGSNCALILERLGTGRKILVFGKVADELNLFGVTISRYSTEEEALCKLLSPLWNRAAFPGSVTSQKLAKKNSKNYSKYTSEFKNELEEDTSLWFEELKFEDQDRLSRIVRYAESIDILRDMPQKIIGGYTKQPAGYNGIPMIVYGRFAKSGKIAHNAWFLRIPQPTRKAIGLTIFVPQCFAADQLNLSKVGTHGAGNQALFYPLDVDDFLLHPEEYINWTNFDTRLSPRKARK